MSYPVKYTRQFDFQSYQNANPTRPLPGDKINADLNSVVSSVGGIVDFLKGVTRADGKLANGSVGVDQLDPSLITNLTAAVDATFTTFLTAAANSATASENSSETSQNAAAVSALQAANAATSAANAQFAIGGLPSVKTNSFRHSLEFGWSYFGPPNEQLVTTPDSVWMLRSGFGSLWGGLLGVTATGVCRIDPVTGAIVTTIANGTPNSAGPNGSSTSSEVRGICITAADVWAVDRVSGELLRINPATNTIRGRVTGIAPNNSTQSDGPFGCCADVSGFIYVGITQVAAVGAKLYKFDISKIPTNGSSVTLATALATGSNTTTLGVGDTHNLVWDGINSVVVTALNTTSLFYVNTSTMVATTLTIDAGGSWAALNDGEHMWISEISTGRLLRRIIGSTGNSIHFRIQPLSGVADMLRVEDEIYIAASTQAVPGTTAAGCIIVIDAHTGTIKKTIFTGAYATDVSPAPHVSSLALFNGDVWNVNLFNKTIQRHRRSHRYT